MTDYQLSTYIITCGAALFIHLLLLLDTYSCLSGAIEIKRVRSCILAGIVQCTFYLAESVMELCGYMGSRHVALTFNVLIYLGNHYVLYRLVEIIYSKYLYKVSKPYVKWLFLSPILLIGALDLVNLFLPVYFDITKESLEYVELWGVIPLNILPFLYVLFAGIHDLIEFRKGSYYTSLPVSLFLLPVLIGVILEYYLIDLPLLPLFFSLSMVVLYMYILKQNGFIDSLSGLYMRSHLNPHIRAQAARLKEHELLAGIMLDVDHFKRINDVYGHLAGDACIRAIGDMLRRAAHKRALCFRYGGDEFVLVLKAKSEHEIDALCAELDRLVAAYNEAHVQPFELSISRGCTLYDRANDTTLRFIERMDAQMYEKKRSTAV